MPFQVAFSYKKNEPPALTLITAGEDQQVSCGDTITLTAIVDDEDNLPGHTLEWEQLTGPPVVLSCPTCLITTYPLVDKSEKTFRFWIDRGIPLKEQYDDVGIFHTPTTTNPKQAQTAESFGAVFVPASSPECSSIVRTPPPPDLQSSEVTTGLLLVWDEVERVNLRPFVTQYTVYESGIPVQTTDVNAPREYDGALELVYQIFTELVVNGQYSSEFSCEADFSNEDLIRVIDDYTPHQGQSADPRIFSRTNYGNVVINNADVSVIPKQSQTAEPHSFSRTNYGNVVINNADISVTPKQAQTAIPVVNITRFSSGGIGG